MIRRTARATISVATGKYSAAPNDYVWLAVFELLPVEIRSFTRRPLKREDGSELTFEAEIRVPMIYDDLARFIQLSRDLRVLVTWEVWPGVLPAKNYVGPVLEFHDRHLVIGGDPWEAPV